MSPVSHIKFWDLSFLLGPILRTAVELYNQCVPRCMTGWVAVTRLCTGMLHEGFKYWPRMLAGVCEGIYGVWWPLKKVLCALVLVLWGMQDTGGELSKVHDTNPESCSCGAGDLHQCGVQPSPFPLSQSLCSGMGSPLPQGQPYTTDCHPCWGQSLLFRTNSCLLFNQRNLEMKNPKPLELVPCCCSVRSQARNETSVTKTW